MRSSSTQIANQISVCWRGVLGCVGQWSNSQSASQLKPDRKGIGPLKRIQFLPASTGTRTARWPAIHAGLPYSPMYMKAIVIIIYRTHDRSCH